MHTPFSGAFPELTYKTSAYVLLTFSTQPYLAAGEAKTFSDSTGSPSHRKVSC